MKNSPTIEMCYDLIIATLKANAPKDTGNLAMYSIRRTEDKITIGAEIAPYAIYTEEKNKSSKGWIRKTIDSLVPVIKSIMEGNLKEEEIQNMIIMENNIFDKDIQNLINKEQIKLNKIETK